MTHYIYPDELLSISDLQTIAKGMEEFRVLRTDAVLCGNLDNHPKRSGLFGDHLLVSKAIALAKSKAIPKCNRAIPIRLSEREQLIVEGLG